MTLCIDMIEDHLLLALQKIQEANMAKLYGKQNQNNKLLATSGRGDFYGIDSSVFHDTVSYENATAPVTASLERRGSTPDGPLATATTTSRT